MLKNRTRLRVELLEGREVPAGAIGMEELVDPPVLDAPVEAVTDTGVTDDVITITDILDGSPPVPEIDLSAFVTVDKSKPSVGDLVNFKITVANNGPSPATSVVLTTALPTGVTFVSATPGQGAYDKDTGIWTVGTVYPGGPITLTIKVKVVEPTEQIVTAAITNSDMPDPVVENNAASKTVTPALAGLRLTKAASASTLVVGATVMFTISVRNTGPGTARTIVIKDTLGTGFTFVKAQLPTHGVFTPGTRNWKIGALPTGATATLKIIAIVKSTGRLTGSAAIVSGTGIDELRSKLEATSVVTGTKTNTPATWSYVSLGSSTRLLPVPAGARPVQVLVSAPTTSLKPKFLLPMFVM